jgi:hypothetical protein
MRIFATCLILWLFSTVAILPSLHAQTPMPEPSTAMTASPAPPAQAPDEVTNKITGLVHDGKYAEAQGLTTGLLMAYPNDQRLIKAKALLDKLLSPGASATTTLGASPASRQTLTPEGLWDLVSFRQ